VAPVRQLPGVRHHQAAVQHVRGLVLRRVHGGHPDNPKPQRLDSVQGDRWQGVHAWRARLNMRT